MYDISYANLPRHLADDKAIDDLKSYVGDKPFAVLLQEADTINTDKDWQSFNNMLGFIGVRGYPVHAFGRRYCLTAYREWMHSRNDPVPTDAHGFTIAKT